MQMTMKEYHEDSRLSPSKIAQFSEHPCTYYFDYRMDKKTLDMGTILHEKILKQPKDTQYVKYIPAKGTGSLAINKDFKSQVESEGKVWFPESEFESIDLIYDNFNNNSFLKRSVDDSDGLEQTYFGELNGVDFKCRPDNLFKNVIFDLKTTDYITKRDWIKSIFNFGYDKQAAAYMDIMNQQEGMEFTHFCIVFLCKREPYKVLPYFLPNAVLDNARVKNNNVLDKYKLTKERDSFEMPVYLDIPDYYLN